MLFSLLAMKNSLDVGTCRYLPLIESQFPAFTPLRMGSESQNPAT